MFDKSERQDNLCCWRFGANWLACWVMKLLDKHLKPFLTFLCKRQRFSKWKGFLLMVLWLRFFLLQTEKLTQVFYLASGGNFNHLRLYVLNNKKSIQIASCRDWKENEPVTEQEKTKNKKQWHRKTKPFLSHKSLPLHANKKIVLGTILLRQAWVFQECGCCKSVKGFRIGLYWREDFGL